MTRPEFTDYDRLSPPASKYKYMCVNYQHDCQRPSTDDRLTGGGELQWTKSN